MVVAFQEMAVEHRRKTMTAESDLTRALNRNSEIVALSVALHGANPCDWRCGRLATWYMGTSGNAPMCDECRGKIIERWRVHSIDQRFTGDYELLCAKRVRRLEALLAGEP
jgi:CO/xanthine dehydrogenase FAD-binding subunit